MTSEQLITRELYCWQQQHLNGRMDNTSPIFQLCCFVFTRRANLSHQTQSQTQNRSYLNSHFSSPLKKLRLFPSSATKRAVFIRELQFPAHHALNSCTEWAGFWRTAKTCNLNHTIPPTYSVPRADATPHLRLLACSFFFFFLNHNVLTLVLKRKDLS